MGRAQSDTYISLFNKSDNVNLDETFDRKSALVHVLTYIPTNEIIALELPAGLWWKNVVTVLEDWHYEHVTVILLQLAVKLHYYFCT